MKPTLVVILLVGLAMACQNNKGRPGDGQSGSFFENATQIGELRQITTDDRSIYPVFGPGDTIIFYQRMLLADVQDTFAYSANETVKPYGVHIATGELYTLSKAPAFPPAWVTDPDSLPNNFGRQPAYAIAAPDSYTYAFEIVEGSNQVHTIYLVEGDSLRQITSGSVSCYLDRFSNTGRYLTAIYGKIPTWVLIFDLVEGGVYRIPHDSTCVDYLTSFSPDDRMMLFIRSRNVYRHGPDFFGDIYLFTFDHQPRAQGR